MEIQEEINLSLNLFRPLSGLKPRPSGRLLINKIGLNNDNDRLAEVSSKRASNIELNERNLFSWSFSSSISSNRSEIRWISRSSGRKSSVIQYLFHKWLYSSLNKVEWEFFIEAPGVLSNNMIFSALKARNSGITLRTIRKILEKYSIFLFGKENPSRERYLGLKSLIIRIDREITHRPQKKIIRYSGWKRHHNDHGSLRIPRYEEMPLNLEPISEDDNVILFLQICEKKQLGQAEIFINDIRFKI